MTDTPPNGDLTPPGPPTDPGEPPHPPAPPTPDPYRTPPAGQAYGPAYGAPAAAYAAPSDARGGDTALGWTAFGLALPFCVPFLPLAGLVLAAITLARRRFRPGWIAVVALLAGLVGTGLQVWLVTTDDFWEGFREGMSESIDDDTEDARRSGEPREVSTLKLRPGDCINDPATKGVGEEPIMTETVTLLPCRDRHDLEVYALIDVAGEEFPGQAAFDREVSECFKEFRAFIGKTFADSALEIYYYSPTQQSWDMLGDRSVTCLVGHPTKKVEGTLENSRR